jgi:hypothetical protein
MVVALARQSISKAADELASPFQLDIDILRAVNEQLRKYQAHIDKARPTCYGDMRASAPLRSMHIPAGSDAVISTTVSRRTATIGEHPTTAAIKFGGRMA